MAPDLTTTLALLAATPATLDTLLGHLPNALMHAGEGPGTWTVTQVLAHLVQGEQADWLPRVQIILRAGESETFPIFQRNAHLGDDRSLSHLLSAFAALRAEQLGQLQALQLTPQDLERKGCHPAFGIVTLSQLLATWAAHDLSHLHQIARILASQYREAVGPWSLYLGVLQCDGHSAKA